jgi:thioredoxin reductase (NADPH)
VREPLERVIARGRLEVLFCTKLEEIREREVRLLREDGQSITIPNDVVFILVGSEADFTLMRQLGVETVPSGLTTIPVYDAETFETNVQGVYVVGHFTHARHIKEAIAVPRRIVPLIAKQLREEKQIV